MNLFSVVGSKTAQILAIFTLFTLVISAFPAAAFAQAAPACTIEVVSDETTDNGVLTFVHALWTNISDASWIWSDEEVVDTRVEETQTFTKTFSWSGAVIDADLEIAADNTYAVTLNGTPVGSSAEDLDNFSSTDSYDVDGAIVQGVNTLEFSVVNAPVVTAENDPYNNPAGFIFKLTATGESATCDELPVIDDEEDDKDTETIVVTGNTAAGENLPGWMFNRDLSTASPFEFNTAQQVIGTGALNVLPISAAPADKFIAEYFVLDEIANVDGFSYDFKIGAGGDASDAGQYYMSVYANFGSSADTKFYDCRYSVIPTTGSTASFTTVNFDPTQSYAVTQSGTSPFTCPAVPADMDTQSPNSTFRVFALNTGDTSASDTGLDGYYDNVVLETDTKVTTFDFEPAEPQEPEEPAVCIDDNLVANASFEEPIVDGEWGIFAAVSGWTISSDGLELWRNFMDGASDGEQNAELDGNQPTTISQLLTVVPGNEYLISFDFSPRMGTDVANNNVEVAFAGSVLGFVAADGSTNTGNVWTSHQFNVTAATNSALFELRDKGTADTYGTLIDNVSVCLTKDNSDENPSDGVISGYKFNDEDGDGVWDTETEDGIAGWEIVLSQGDADPVYATTNADGFYSFTVPNGSYQVTETMQKGWEQTALIGDGADGDTCYITVENDRFTCDFGNHATEDIPQCTETENLLTNGGFETPDIESAQGWEVFASVVNGLAWAVRWINPSAGAPAIAKLELQNGRPASEGTQYAELDSNYTNPGEATIAGDAMVEITQTVATVPGVEYTLSYDLSATPRHGGVLNNKVEVRVDDVLVDTQTASGVGATTTNWMSHTLTFTATNTATKIGLGDAGRSDNVRTRTFGTMIDNVSLVGCEPTDTDGGDDDNGGNGGGGNGGSNSRNKRAPAGEVLGASTTTPDGVVLGAATTAMPVGAPNTGAGGTAPVTTSLPVINAILGKTTIVPKQK